MGNNTELMLDICFEIEGLLSLMQKRENEIPQRIGDMLRLKVQKLHDIVCADEAISDNEAIAETAELEEAEDAGKEEQEEPEITGDMQSEKCETDDVEVSGSPRISFTLNDKFRFRRELFGNNAADFADALNVATAMNSQAELDDYFYNDLCWDPENPDVRDFMKIVSARFNQ